MLYKTVIYSINRSTNPSSISFSPATTRELGFVAAIMSVWNPVGDVADKEDMADVGGVVDVAETPLIVGLVVL